MSIRRVTRRVLVGLLLVGALGAGCAEVITYSNKSNAEGRRLMDQGRYEEAAGAFRDATQQNPRHYQSFFYLGQCYDKMGREQQALQSYRAAVDVMPEVERKPLTPEAKELVAFRERAVNGLGECIARSESRDAELAAAEERATRSRRAVDWYALARAYVAMGDADNAIIAYNKALSASESQDQPIAKSFGLYLLQVNQPRPGEIALRKAFQINPNDAEVNAALRKLGVVPGPSLLEQDQLNKPVIPKGPIPEVEINVKDANKKPAAGATPR